MLVLVDDEVLVLVVVVEVDVVVVLVDVVVVLVDVVVLVLVVDSGSHGR